MKNNPVIEQNFYRRVLIQLQQLLDLAKRSDSLETRKKFQWYCEQLLILGNNAKVERWPELLKTCQEVIASPKNNYQTATKLIIKEIKHSAELVIAGRESEIKASTQLAAMIPAIIIKSQAAPQTPQAAPQTPQAAPQTRQAAPQTRQAAPQAPPKAKVEPPKSKINYPDPWQTAKISQPGQTKQNTQGQAPTQSNQKAKQPEKQLEKQPEKIDDDFLELFDSFDDLFPQTPEKEQTNTNIEQSIKPSKTEETPKKVQEVGLKNTYPSINFEQELTDLFNVQDNNIELFEDFEQIDTSSEENITNNFEDIFNLSNAERDEIVYYQQLEDLEQLIDESVDLKETANKALMFAELEKLIDSKATLTKATISEKKESNTELLLEQVNQTIERLPKTKAQEDLAPMTLNRPGKAKMFEQNMRVPVKQLDNLSNLIGELVVKRNKLEEDQERLRQFLDNLLNRVQALSKISSKVQEAYDRSVQEENLQALRHQGYIGYANISSPMEVGNYKENYGLGSLELDRYNIFQQLAQEIIELIVRVRESASDIEFLVDETDQVARNLRQVTTQLQEGLNKARMVTFAQVADRLPRAVREISLQLNKQAELHIEGRDVLIDKMIIEHLYNPMTHLINNAITHGIETPDVRRKNGKPPLGKITVSSFLQGNQTLIVVSDDGAGINRETVKAKAIQKGLITRSEAKIMSHQEVYDLLFHPGFSTKDTADDFSGRGVGLDVVRTSLIPIRGSVSIQSNLGEGTTFTIRLPLTLSICKALCCISNNARIAFPIDGVEGSKDYSPSEVVFDEQGRKCINWEGTMLPYQNLGNLLSYNRQISRSSVYAGQQDDDTICIVVLQGAGNLLAIEVDKLLPEQEIVINQIEGPVPKPAGIAGATVLGDGRVMPIGDVLELIEIAEGRRSTDSSSNLWKKTSTGYINVQTTAVKNEPMVLIVDDSITVRQMLSLSFAKAGYRVEEARDGQEAWEKLRGGLPCDIVFCDLEMPRMDGLTLLQNMHNDPVFSSIPIALLTSRSTEKHKNIAAELGASGYFTKPYTEKDLLDAAERMIKGETLIGNLSKGGSYSKTSQGQNGDPLILIVDDSMIVREMLSITFKNAGYRVEQARDGQEAIDKIRTGLYCSLVFCDIEMPRMDGLTFLSRLQEEPEFNQIPVAMITSRGAEKHRRLAAERGAKAYFTKPYIDDDLLRAAKKLMDGEVLIEEVNPLKN